MNSLLDVTHAFLIPHSTRAPTTSISPRRRDGKGGKQLSIADQWINLIDFARWGRVMVSYDWQLTRYKIWSLLITWKCSGVNFPASSKSRCWEHNLIVMLGSYRTRARLEDARVVDRGVECLAPSQSTFLSSSAQLRCVNQSYITFH